VIALKRFCSGLALALAACSGLSGEEAQDARQELVIDPTVCLQLHLKAWRPVVQIGQRASFSSALDLAASSNGDAVVVWLDAGAFDTYTEFASSYHAGAWGAPFTVATFSFDPAHATSVRGPRVAMDASGNAMVVWDEHDTTTSPATFRIRSRRYVAGTGWDAAVLLASGSLAVGQGSPVDVASDDMGNALAAWTMSDASARRFSASTSTWDAAQLIESSMSNATSLRIASAAGGRAVASWRQLWGVGIQRFDPATGWLGLPSYIVEPSSPPEVAINASADAVIGYGSPTPNGSQDVRIARWPAAASFPQLPIQVAAAAATGEPDLAIDPYANVFTTWSQVGAVQRDVVSARVSSANVVSPAETLDNRSEPAREPVIAVEGDHGFGLWKQSNGRRGGLFANRLFHQRRSFGCPERFVWTGARVVQDTDALVFSHEIAVNSSGQAFAVWIQEGSTSGWEVWGAVYR
jgi:hypothetical protein